MINIRLIKSSAKMAQTSRLFSSSLLCRGPAKFIKFDWKDPFTLESQLTEEEVSIRDTAHQYCQTKLLPRVIKANREESNLRLMTELIC